ncbi:MAG: hypothetical protein ACI9G9_001498 [Psychromonas sp.]|jgi:hypothetical protein
MVLESYLHNDLKRMTDATLSDTYKSQKKSLQQENKYELILEFFGVVDQLKIGELSAKLENILFSHEPNSTLQKRIFLIVLEALQNIYNHSLPDKEGNCFGGFCVLHLDGEYILYFVSPIESEKIDVLSDQLTELNSQPLDQLKENYLNQLKNGQISQKGGAGLGLKGMRSRSRQPIEFAFRENKEWGHSFHVKIKLIK